MAIIQGFTASCKKQVLEGKHDFTAGTGHTFKVALYTEEADLSPLTENYTTDGEASGAGYTPGGIAITSTGVSVDGKVAFVNFENAVFSGVTLSARGALIYNTTTGGGSGTTDSVCVLDFGLTKTFTNEDIRIRFPYNDASHALIRVM